MTKSIPQFCAVSIPCLPLSSYPTLGYCGEAALNGEAVGFIYSSTSDLEYKTPDQIEVIRKDFWADSVVSSAISSGFVPPSVGNVPNGTDTADGGYYIDPKVLRIKRLRRTIRNAANAHTKELQDAGVKYTAHFLTLTYAPGVDWSPRHISALIKSYRQYFADKDIKLRYVWVGEIQERRVSNTGEHGVHYHVVFWLPKGIAVPKSDKRGWWPHGMTNTQKARNPTAYIMKYATKGTKCKFPKGFRTHGSGGLSKDSRLSVAWWNIPKYVRDTLGDFSARICRASGGGWVSRLTGEWIPSLYKIISFSPLIIVPTGDLCT